MNTYYKNDLKHAYFILEGKEGEQEDYQLIMLQENEIPGLLRTEVRHIDHCNHYYYEISGKTSVQIYHEKIPLGVEDIKKIVEDLMATIRQVQRYMLDAACILLEPEMIYRTRDTYFFCYYPSGKMDLRESFHQLTEFFVRQVDYQDEEGVRLAYTLHKATMEENYSIEEIMKEFVSEETSREIEEMNTYAYQDVEVTEEDDDEDEEESLWSVILSFFLKKRR